MRKNIQKPLSILLSLVLALSVFGCLSLTAFAEGEKWSITSYQCDDASAEFAVEGNTLTYWNIVADYVYDARDDYNRGMDAWWLDGRITLNDLSIKDTVKAKIGSYYYTSAQLFEDGEDFFDLWVPVLDTQVEAAKEGDGKITYTVEFYNDGDTEGEPDQTLSIVIDVTRGVELKKDGEVVLKLDAPEPEPEPEPKPAKENFLAKLQKFFKKLLAIAKKLTKILEAFTSKAEETA